MVSSNYLNRGCRKNFPATSLFLFQMASVAVRTAGGILHLNLSDELLRPIPRITATPAALELIEMLRVAFGPLMFHQSGGCCDGSAPMCFERNEFRTGSGDVLIGVIENETPFWMSEDQFQYWQHTQLTLDVVNGRGSSFSLEIPTGKRFIIRSRMFAEHELPFLEPLRRA